MPTSPTPLPTIPPFPALADRATGTYNSKAYGWATGWKDDIAPAIEALADNAYDNAVEGAASAAAAAASAALSAQATGTAIGFTFDVTTTDADPGAGKLRLNNATQNTATVIRADNTSAAGSDVAALLATFGNGTSTVKGRLRIQKATDATKWLIFDVTAVASPSGYKNITASCTAFSAANPFADGDALAVSFTATGDKGDPGATGAAGTLSGNASGGINELRGSTLASATDMGAGGTNCWTAAQGNNMAVSGTTPTTSFGTAPQAGAKRNFYPSGAWPITAGANVTIPGISSGNTYTCTAGDRVEVTALTTTTFLVNIFKQDGTAMVGSSGTLGTLGTAVVVKTYNSGVDKTLCRLSDTLGLVAYKNSSNYVCVNAVTRSGASLSMGTEVVVEAAAAAGGRVELRYLSATTALLLYGVSGATKVVVVSVSGTVCSVGTAQTIYAAATYYSMTMLTATTALVVTQKSGYVMHAMVISVSGTTITTNTGVDVDSDAATENFLHFEAAALSATKVIVYGRKSNSQTPVLVTISISGTTPSLLTTKGSSLGYTYGGVCTLSTGNVLLLFSSNVSSSGTSVGTTLAMEALVSGSDIIFSQPVVIGQHAGDRIRPMPMTNGKALLGMPISSLGQAAAVLARKGSSEVWEVAAAKGLSAFNSTGTSSVDVCQFSADYAVALYSDPGNSSYATVRTVALGTFGL